MSCEGAADGAAPMSGARVWDLPTRVFHWLLAIGVTFSWITGTLEVDDFDIHMMSGYCILGLLMFRLVWGLVGSGPSRFKAFVKGPGSVMRYAAGMRRRSPSHWPGHNPLGGWSVVAMLVVLLATITAGLFSDDEVLYQGPLAAMVSVDTRATATGIHHLLTNVVLLLVALHVTALAYYAVWKRENLVTAMFTGRSRNLSTDELPAPVLEPRAVATRFVVALVIGAAVALLVVNARALFAA